MKFIRINAADNVAVALQEVEAGTRIDIDGVDAAACCKIPAGHKVALQDMEEIGRASCRERV